MNQVAFHSAVIITSDFAAVIARYRAMEPQPMLHVVEGDDFLVEHAVEAVRLASLATETMQIIVLAAKRFSPIAQNKLLKILEEPPPNTAFLLLTPLKSALLATIRSRLPVHQEAVTASDVPQTPELGNLDLQTLYDFVRENRSVDAAKARMICEKLAMEALQGGRFRTDEALLESFARAARLLDMGSPPAFVITALLVQLLQRRGR